MNWGSTGMNLSRPRPEARPSLFGDNVPSRDITTAGRISAISPDLKDPAVTFVKVAGQVVAKVPFMEVDNLGLRVGATWSSMLAKSCEQVWVAYEAKETCVKLLAVKERTSVELHEKLVTKGVSKDIATKVIEDLKRSGIINDERAAEAIAHSESKKGSSSGKIKARLRNAGVDKSASSITVKSDRKAAKDAANQLAAKLNGKLTRSVKWKRVLSGLARRGFDEDTARAATRAVLGPEPD